MLRDWGEDQVTASGNIWREFVVQGDQFPSVPPPHVIDVHVLWSVAWVTHSCPTDVLVAVKPKMAAIGQNNTRDVASMGSTLSSQAQVMILCFIGAQKPDLITLIDTGNISV